MDILEILASHDRVSGEEIARRMDITRAAVHKRIQKLRERGYRIDGERKAGYTLVSSPDVVTPGAVASLLPAGGVIGRRVVHLEATGSTQEVVKALASAGEREGTVVIAETQTGSYGRFRREWTSPRGGLWLSLLLRPQLPPEEVPRVALVLSVALCEAIERLCGLRPLIKWPNDVMLEGGKAAGIIVEMGAEPGRTDWVAAGIGINVNNDIPASLDGIAVSLARAAGHPLDRARLAAELIGAIDRLYTRFLAEGFGAARDGYVRRSMLEGRKITVSSVAGERTGIVRGIDAGGALQLETAPGRIEPVIAGEVTVDKRSFL